MFQKVNFVFAPGGPERCLAYPQVPPEGNRVVWGRLGLGRVGVVGGVAGLGSHPCKPELGRTLPCCGRTQRQVGCRTVGRG
jgi:hypothetical protein